MEKFFLWREYGLSVKKENLVCRASGFLSQINNSLIFLFVILAVTLDGTSHIVSPLVASGNPNVFKLEHNSNGLWLNNNWAKPDNNWNLDNEFVLRFRKYFFSALFLSAVFVLR